MEKKKVLVADPISEKGIADLQACPSLDVVVKIGIKPEELLATAHEYEGIAVRSQTKITAAVLEKATRLKAVGRAGVGVDNIDVQAANKHGVIVMNTPGGNTVSTAEHAFSLMMSLARHIPQAHASMVAGKWDRKNYEGVELNGKTLAILGMGRIGTEFARRAMAFGMRVVAYDPYLSPSRAQILRVELMQTVEEAVADADFITMHMPLTKETKYLLNGERLAKCKKGVRIINCARGGLVEEAALVEALKSGHVAGAALDVYETEPPAKDHPILSLPNVVLTPHLGASTAEAQEKCGIEVAEVIAGYLLTGEVRNAVNLPYLDAKTYDEVKPYLILGEKIGKLLAQLAPAQVDRLYVTYGGKAQELPNIDPITRAVLQGFLSRASVKDLNNVNVRSIASTLGLTVEEKRSSEPVTFNEWLHVQAYHGSEKVISAGGTFFGSPNNPRIVRLFSLPVEIPISGIFLLLTNQDRPGMVGHIGTMFGRHQVNIANMSLHRAEVGGQAFTVFTLDSAPPPALLEELHKDTCISNVKVVIL